MAKDPADVVRETLTSVVEDVTKSIGLDGKGRSSSGPLAGGRGVAAGAGLAAVAPLVAKGAVNAIKRRMGEDKDEGGDEGDESGGMAQKGQRLFGNVASKLTGDVGKQVGDTMKEKVDESGGVAGLAKEAGKSMLPGVGGGGGSQQGAPGVGQGRRMPVQQSMDVGVPLETCYNQWTQFEEWPSFMHRVMRASKDEEDPTSVSFTAKMWGTSREFTATIDTQRPDERIKWHVEQGISHEGVVTFHELAPRLTRVEMNVDVDPGSLMEKAARGMRHIKRAMRADMHRFKAYIEMQEQETGAWRGVIEDGEVVEDHDPSYDEDRAYAGSDGAEGRGEEEEEREPEAEAEGEEPEDEGEEPEDEDEGEPEDEGEGEEPEDEEPEEEEEKRPRRRRAAASARSSSERSRSASSGGQRSRPSAQRSRSTGKPSRSSSQRSGSGRKRSRASSGSGSPSSSSGSRASGSRSSPSRRK